MRGTLIRGTSVPVFFQSDLQIYFVPFHARWTLAFWKEEKCRPRTKNAKCLGRILNSVHIEQNKEYDH